MVKTLTCNRGCQIPQPWDILKYLEPETKKRPDEGAPVWEETIAGQLCGAAIDVQAEMF